MLQPKHRNQRSSSASLSHDNKLSFIQSFDSLSKRFTDTERKLKQIQAILKAYQSKKQNKQNRVINLRSEDYDQCVNGLRNVNQKFCKINSAYESLFQNMQQQNNKLKQNKDKQIRIIHLKHQEEMNFSQSEYNKNLMSMNYQFSKKQQDYKELFTNFVESLNKAQRIWALSFTTIEQKCRNLAEFILRKCQYEQKHKQFYEEIIFLVNQLNIRRDSNDSIISRSEDFSYNQFSPVMKNNTNTFNKFFKCEQKKNTIEMSSIEPIQQQETEEQPENKQIQNALGLLINIGFFNPQNLQYVQKMFEVSAKLDECTQLIHSPIYPLLIQSLKVNIKKQQKQKSVQNQIIQEQSISFHSPLPSNRDNTVQSIASRHLDIEQLIENQQSQRKQKQMRMDHLKKQCEKKFFKKR